MADSITFQAPAYAGFWRRVAASTFDQFFFLGWVLPFMAMLTGSNILIAFVAFIPVVILYFVALESSPVQATVGKLLMGIDVTDAEGGRLSFLRSLVRNVIKAILFSFLIGGLMFLTAAFTERKRAPPDMVVGALVVDRGGAGFGRGLTVFIGAFFVFLAGIAVFWGTITQLAKNSGELVQSIEGVAPSQTSIPSPARPAASPVQAPQPGPPPSVAPVAPVAPAVAPRRAEPAVVEREPAPAPKAVARPAPAAAAAPLPAAPKRRPVDDCVIKPVMTDEDVARCRR